MGALSAVLRLLGGVNVALLGFCRYATIGLVAAIAVVVCAGVFWRYVLNDALSWAEEVAKYCMIWMVFTGAPIALRQGGHVAIEILPNALPVRARHALFAVVFLLIAALMAVFVHRGLTFAWNGRTQMAITVGDISMAWIFAAVPVGGLVMLLVAAEAALVRLGGALWPDRFAPHDEHGEAAARLVRE